MEESMLLLKEKFEEIKKKGYVKSTRKGPTGIGKTFEDLLGKKEDNKVNPDFMGIEIKTKTAYSIRPTTLFTATPMGNSKYEIKRLVNAYGLEDKNLATSKVFNTAVYANSYRYAYGKSALRLKVDRTQEKIILNVYDMNMRLIENQVYWTFSELKERLYKKLQYLAVVRGIKRVANGNDYYSYYKIDFYKLKDFEEFIRMIELGIISIEFHIGTHKRGKRTGEIHDRGTNFRIKECNLTKLFDKLEV